MHVQATQAHDATVFLFKSLGIDIGPCLRMIEARNDRDELLGVVGFNNWMGGSCSAHVAIQDPRAFLPLFRHALRYTFGQLGLKAVIGYVNSSRTRWLEGHYRVLGYTHVATIVNGGLKGDDLVVLELRPESCRMWQLMLKKEAAVHG
jgi:hypothetical protein